MQGYIEHTDLRLQKPGCQLFQAGHLDRETGLIRGAFQIGNFLGPPHGMVRTSGPEGRHLVEYIPAHGIDGRGREHQPRLYLGPDFHTAEGGTTGFADALGQGFSRQGHIHRPLRHRSLGHAHVALLVRSRETAAVHRDHRPEFYIHQGSLAAFIALAAGLQELRILRHILMDTEHFLIHLAGVVPGGKALAVKSSQKGIHHFLGHRCPVNGLPIDSGDGGYILWPFHPALQL